MKMVYLIPKYQDTMRFDLIISDIWNTLNKIVKIKLQNNSVVQNRVETSVYMSFLRNLETCNLAIENDECVDSDGVICLVKLPKQPPGIDKFKPKQNPKLPTLVNV